MIDHLLFDKLKWWNVDTTQNNVTISGKSYIALPKKMIIKAGTEIHLSGPITYVNHDITVTVCGKTKACINEDGRYVLQDYYVSIDSFFQQYSHDADYIESVYVATNKVTPIWG